MDIGSKGLQFGRHIRHVGRFAQIANVLARHGFWSVLEAAGVHSWLTPEQMKVAEEISRTKAEGGGHRSPSDHLEGLPARLRSACEELGPAFVKLGQVMASREDLLPDSFVQELRKLHSDVYTLPFKQIRQVLEEELGEEGLAQFSEIGETPLAAGSIGQVHAAELKDDGRRVVIKVQRPNIAEQIKVDLSLMEILAGLLEKYVPELRGLRPRVMVQEFSRGMLSELDFVQEGGNTTKFRHNFEGMPYIDIPEVHWGLTTPRVITLSWLDGFSVNDKEVIEREGLDPKLIVERGLKAFLQMVFVDGMYHGDLHAGNLLALPGNHIGILDFGLSIQLGRMTRENLAGLLVALVNEDYEALVSHFVELTDPDPSFNIQRFEEDVANTLAPFVGLNLAEISTGKLLWRLARLSADHGAPMPRQLIIFFKTLASFEGVGSRLSPDFNVITACESFSQKLVKQMYSPEAVRRQSLIIARDVANLARFAPRQVRGLLKTASEGDLKLNVASADLRYAATSLDRLMSRLAVSMILSSFIIGSSILVLAKVGREFYNMSYFGFVGFAIAGILGVYVVWSILRGSGLKM